MQLAANSVQGFRYYFELKLYLEVTIYYRICQAYALNESGQEWMVSHSQQGAGTFVFPFVEA